MPKKIAFWIDPIEALAFEKDSTIQMMLCSQKKGCVNHILGTQNIQLIDGEVTLWVHEIVFSLQKNKQINYQTSQPCLRRLDFFDALMIRKDPPFDQHYLHACQLLAKSEQSATIYNRPSSLCKLNEKIITQYFGDLTPEQIITASFKQIFEFAQKHKKIVLKPLDGMGGRDVFITTVQDPNFKIIINNLTAQGRNLLIAQEYLPDIAQGDKRIILINGKPISHVLVRQVQGPWGRGNLAQNASALVRPIQENEQQICRKIASFLQENGLFFVGLDVIGDKITEINITSPTGLKEISGATDQSVLEMIIEQL